MNRELALKDVLVLAGLLFVAAVYPESERLKSAGPADSQGKLPRPV